jgi:hypothetical protein
MTLSPSWTKRLMASFVVITLDETLRDIKTSLFGNQHAVDLPPDLLFAWLVYR